MSAYDFPFLYFYIFIYVGLDHFFSGIDLVHISNMFIQQLLRVFAQYHIVARSGV